MSEKAVVSEKAPVKKKRRPAKRPCGAECCFEPTPARVISKVGMVASMGAAIASGVLKFKGAKPLHTIASIAFVGFTAAHYVINRPPKRTAK